MHGACVSTLRSVRLCRYIEATALCIFTPYADRCFLWSRRPNTLAYLSPMTSVGLPIFPQSLAKPLSTLGFLRRNLRKFPAQLKERAYIAFVRSTLGYASPILDPFLKRDINNLEKINRRAARFVTGDYHAIPSVSSMLRSLGWSDIKDRRRDTQLALLFKIVNGDVAVSADDLHLEPADRRTRSNHRHKYKHKGASTPELFSLSYYKRVELASCL